MMPSENNLLLTFGNELNLWSEGLFYKILDKEDISGLFLPSVSLDNEFFIDIPDFVKIQINSKASIIASRVYPKLLKFDTLKKTAEKLHIFSENKFIVLSFAFLRINTLTLLFEKFKDLIEQVGHVELNLVPAFFKITPKDRDHFIFRLIDTLSESINTTKNAIPKIYVKIPPEWLRIEYLKALQEHNIDTIIVSLHNVISYRGAPYFVHSPLLSHILLNRISLLNIVTNNFPLNYGFSIDIHDIKSLDDMPEKISILQLDLNLLDNLAIQQSHKISGSVAFTFDNRLYSTGFRANINTLYCNKCRSTYLCKKICPENAIRIRENFPIVDFNKCSMCGLCIVLCPENAIEKVRLIIPD